MAHFKTRFLLGIKLLILYFFISINLFGQSNNQVEKRFFDASFDYYPQIKGGNFYGSIGKSRFSGEFSECLTKYVSQSLNLNYAVKRFSSRRIYAGMFPRELKKSIWMKIELDSNGKLEAVNVYDSTLIDEEFTQQMKKFLESCRILPALKNHKPVRSELYFILKEQC